jgi:adenylate cyclase
LTGGPGSIQGARAMSDAAREGTRLAPAPGALVQRLRLVTGLVLFAFLLTHLGNHALGLISLEAMQQARAWRIAMTRSELGEFVLVVSALIHLSLGVHKFLERRTLRISYLELVQLAFGLLIPLLLMRHILGTHGVNDFFGVDDDYRYALWVMWPAQGIWQAVLITLAWTHGCIGIFQWLRLKPWFVKVRTPLIAFAVLLPVLSYVGFVMAARVLQAETEFNYPLTDEQYAYITYAMDMALYGYLAFLGLLVAARIGRAIYERFQPRVEIAYAGGPRVRVPVGFTILEVSRMHGIPHASICGGRSRCSTCRVRVLSGGDHLPEPNPSERRVLERIGAAGNVRLACQTRPTGDLEIATLLPVRRTEFLDAALFDKYYWGVEEEVTILFCDLRGFTAISENRLPFDIVFMLNQYLSRMSEAIEDAGGYVDKFIGDGIMAIFGIGRPVREGACDALAAVKAMGGVLEGLNMSLRADLPKPLDVALGLNTGPVILGRIGSADREHAARHITALGDTVNTASRIESACREFGVQLLISARTLEAAGVAAPGAGRHDIKVKGKTREIAVYEMKRAIDVAPEWTAKVPVAA